MKKTCVWFLTFFFGGLMSMAFAAGDPIRLETSGLALQLDAKGVVTSLIDKQTGKDWLRPKFEQRFCLLTMKKGTTAVAPKAIAREDNLIKVTFANDAVATLKFENKGKYMTLEVVSVETPGNVGFYKLEFGRAFTDIDYQADAPFAVSSMILNINTNTMEMPGLSTRLGGICYSDIGYKGAKIANLGLPTNQLRDAMKTVVTDLWAQAEKDAAIKESLPVLSKTGGPFAMDQAKSHGNYIIASVPITAEESTVWAEHLKPFGVDQIDFHQGGPFMQADFTFNEKAYPNGVSDFRKMTDAFRQKGIICGLHTYATCVPMHGSKYVKPVPHKDLSVIESFTLAEDMTADATSLRVAESIDHMSIITGYVI